ncbi:translocation and assembly module lipoprotein TamL [Chitinophaga nivalis]|uniref:Outer membrane protein assembly factor n=1 Tax=Chitinophaga nivalis TaxID=2991709 RepID=A0ABT3IV96_9BACT|nr:outer membrane protein assembly factor [Chitinophaga nivalis]MCW3462419.1 outer membrane protein assembly factor [Chitinophaga nivalis]MCW3487890.1 outer membrane protein assembly factor [Chitinophaga nivalis]
MRTRNSHIIVAHVIVCLAMLVISACSTTRTVPAGDRLYTGSSIKWENDSTSKKKSSKPKDYSTLNDGLNKKIRPNTNRKFLGMPFKLWLYNLGKEPKGKGLNYLLRKKWGEAPVLLSQVKSDYTSKVLQGYLVDNGYFEAAVSSQVKNIGKKKAEIKYTVAPHHRYTIKSVTYLTDSSAIGRTVNKSRPGSVLIEGKPYSLDMIKAERERIHADLKEQGYYYFTPDYLLVQVDSTNNGTVDLFVKIKDNTPMLALRPYRMHDITLYPDYSLENDSASTMGTPLFYKGNYIVDSAKRFKPIVFERSVFLRPDSLYRLSSHNITLQRLINLGTFKFVKGQFRPIRDTSQHNIVGGSPNVTVIRDTASRPRKDSAARRDALQSVTYRSMVNNRVALDSGWLDAKFYLTPYKRRSLQAELRGTSKSNGFIGSQVKLTAKNRNWLHSANLLEISLSGGMEWQTGNRSAGGSNSYAVGAEVAVTVPRFLTPIKGINIRTPYVPRTRISAGYELYSRANLYNLNAYTLQLQYMWQRTAFLSHTFAPIAVTYVLPTKTTAAYDSILKNDPSQRAAIEKQFIMGGNYTITYNNQSANRIHSFYLSGNLDVSGNLAGLLIKKGDSTKNILKNPFAQYERLTLEARHYWALGKGKQWINRLILGYGLPYGNSSTLPFVKQFFTGGSSSIRSFRARTLGPGSYHNPRVDSSALLANEAGDIKLEFNSEVRIHVASVFNVAAFVDAGNIWLQKQVPDKPGSQFKFDTFYKEIAVGAGVGVRIDASIVVVRFDMAMPLRIPYLPENERWVINKINFGDPEWRKKNLILNIAIGYPF